MVGKESFSEFSTFVQQNNVVDHIISRLNDENVNIRVGSCFSLAQILLLAEKWGASLLLQTAHVRLLQHEQFILFS